MIQKDSGYKLSRDWFDFSFENPEKVRPIHSAIYFFAVEHCNRLGWKEKFGFPTQMAMEAIGVKNWRTYNKALNELVDWGFIEMVQKSKNQYSSCVICLCKKYIGTVEAGTESLDKALSKHGQKHCRSTVVIDKQTNKEQTNKQTRNNATTPTLQEVLEYFSSNGYPEKLAEKFYRYYQEPMEDRNGRVWKDQNGKTVKSWKQKALAVWMKDESKNSEVDYDKVFS